MKTSGLNPATAPDGSEEVPVLQGVGAARELVRMPVSALAEAGTRPTPAELQAAILAALIDGPGISFDVDEEAGTVTIEVDSAILATKTELADGLATKQASSALLSALAALSISAGDAGKVIKVNPAGNGFVLADDEEGAGGGALVDGTYGDVVISGGGTVFTVVIATDEAYGAGWNADKGPATKNALYTKLEAMTSTIAGKVATASVGVANGVASLDATGKVPAGQLPSYVDDVLEYANASSFPAVGEAGKIYVALDTGRQSRWSGSAYTELTASPGTTDAVPEGSTNKYYTDIRVRASVMTGLVDTVGTPASTDSLLTILGKLKRQAYSQVVPLAGNATMTGYLSLEMANTQLHLKSSGNVPTAMHRVDGSNYYILVSDAAAGINGTWNALRPFMIELATGKFHSLNGQYFVGGADFGSNLNIVHNGTPTILFSKVGSNTSSIFNDGNLHIRTPTLWYDAAGHYWGPEAGGGGWMQLGLDNGAPALTVAGRADFAQPNSGTTGGIRLRGNATSGYAYLQATDAGVTAQWSFLRWSANGDLYHSAALVVQGNISSLSDRRLKKNVRALKGGLDLVKSLRGVRYVMKTSPDQARVGVIAQEVEAIVPEVVSTDGEGVKAVDYGKLTAVLIEAVKELSAQVDRQAAELKTLKAARA